MKRNRLNKGLFRQISLAVMLALLLLLATSQVALAQPTSITFTTTAQPIIAGEASTVMTIKTNVNVTGNTTINLFSSHSETGKFSLSDVSWVDITSVIIPNGTDKVSFYYKDTTTGTPTITAAEFPDTGWTDATQEQTIDPASLDHFVFDTISNQTAGTPFSITITAEDAFDNTVTSYAGTNSLSDTTGTISPTTTPAFTAGVWTGDVTITKAQTAVRITTTQTGDSISRISDSFDVNPASLDHFVLDAISNQTAGTPFSITITAEDAFYNTVTSYAGTNSLSDTTGTISPATTGAFTAGVWTGDVTITKAETAVRITTTQTGDSISGISDSFDVISGAIAQLAFTTNPQTITAGEASTVMTIQIQDNLDNLVNAPLNIKINLTSSSVETGKFSESDVSWVDITSVTILSGSNSASFYYKDTTAGTPTITAAEDPDQGWTDTTQQETVTAAAIAKLVFTTDPQTIGAGNVSGTITIQARDEFGNPSAVAVDTTITLTSTSTQGKFSESAAPWGDTNLVFIPADSNSVSFYYKDTTTGTPTITTAEFPDTGWTDASQQQTITSPPVTTTTAANPHSITTATLYGNLTGLGTAANVTVSFEWGTTTNYGNETTLQTMTETGTFTAALSGLNPDTTYHFRAKAVGDGTSFGEDKLFTTPNVAAGGGGGGGGGGGAPPPSVQTLHMLGDITGVKIKSDGTILESYVIASPSGNVSLKLDSGTKVICSGNLVPTELKMTLSEQPPPMPEGMVAVSPVYNLTANISGGVPRPVTFDPPVILQINYEPEELPENVSSVFLAYYDEELGWIRLEPSGDSIAAVGRVTSQVSHFTPFAVLAELAPPPPARFEVRNLDIKPNQVTVGESTTISAQLVNIGGLSGEHTLMVNIEGLLETSQVITLAPGQSQETSFTVTASSPGSYQVDIGGLQGNLVVLAIPTPLVPPPPSPAPAAEVGESGWLQAIPSAARGGYEWLKATTSATMASIAAGVSESGWLIAIVSVVTAIAAFAFTIVIKRLRPATVVGKPPKPIQGTFRVSNLGITPRRVKPTEGTTVTAHVANNGSDTSILSLLLRVKGVAEAIKEVTLDPGQSQKVAFTILRDKPGVYDIELEGLKDSFTVE